MKCSTPECIAHCQSSYQVWFSWFVDMSSGFKNMGLISKIFCVTNSIYGVLPCQRNRSLDEKYAFYRSFKIRKNAGGIQLIFKIKKKIYINLIIIIVKYLVNIFARIA